MIPVYVDADQNKPKPTAGGRRLGQGMTFGMGLAPEISKLSSAFGQINSRANTFGTSLEAANKNYAFLVDADALPAPAEYASRIESVLLTLETAKTASEELIKARKDFIAQLESLTSVHKSALEAELKQQVGLQEKEAHMLSLKEDIQEMVSGPPMDSDTKSVSPPTSNLSLEDLLASTAKAAAATAMATSSSEEDIRVPDPEFVPLSDADTDSSAPHNKELDPVLAQFLSTIGGSTNTAKDLEGMSAATS